MPAPPLEDLPVEDWPRLIRELQKQHLHHRVTVEERAPGTEEEGAGTWVVVEAAPLVGLSFASMPSPSIEVAWRSASGRSCFHRAVEPVRLGHARDASGREVELFIARRDGGLTRLCFTR